MKFIKNITWNIIGSIIPILVAFPCMGILSRLLGVERFGIFTLTFAIVGYASIFDAGISRAVIREIAIYKENVKEQKKIISTALVSVALLSLIATLLVIVFSFYASSILNISSELDVDVTDSFFILALIIPFFLINQIMLAYLEGLENFSNINLQKIVSSSCLILFPTLLVFFSSSLVSACIGLLLGRILSTVMGWYFSRHIFINNKIKIDITVLTRLIHFGGWLTVSNIISPVMVYFDRFIISHLMGAQHVAYYTVPSEAVSRLLSIPAAVSRALFPKLSYLYDIKHENKKIC